MTTIMRPAEPGDAAALVALANEVTAEPEGWLLTESAWRTVAEERRFLRALRRHPHGMVFVAEEDGEVVGRLSVSRDPHPASSHVADLGLMVARAHRRRGVGAALMRAAEAWARNAGVDKLELHVFPHNAPAIALYEKLGYSHEGRRRAHYRRPDGNRLDAILMAKLLAP